MATSQDVPHQAQTKPSPGATATSTHSPNGSTAEDQIAELSGNEDPEWDFGEGKKYKRSEAIKRIKDFEKGARRAMEQSAGAKKNEKAFRATLERLEIPYEEFLADPEATFDKIAYARINRQVDEANMDPKDRELTQRERAIAEREEKIAARDAQEQEQAKVARIDARVAEITEAWTPVFTEVGLPANPKTIARAADVMSAALRKHVKLDPREVANYVKKQIKGESTWHLEQAQTPEEALEAVGPRVAELIRQALVSAHQQKRKPQHPKAAAETPRDAGSGKYMGWGEYATKHRRI